MTTSLLCFFVIFGSHFLLCCSKPVAEWHTSSAEDTGKSNPYCYGCTPINLVFLSLVTGAFKKRYRDKIGLALFYGALLELFNCP